LHEVFGIDVDDSALMAARPWRWLRSRVLSLLDRPDAIVPYQMGEAQKIAAVPSTRVGRALRPPKFE
jgi:hypothetical protein